MVFVDISGFTAMSERLAKHGKTWGRELTAVIAATFHELLAAAYSFGASLLKFGGDALLLFFTGDEHAARSCAAARAMQQRLDVVGVCHQCRESDAADVGRHPQRHVRLLPGGRLSS